MEVLWITGIVVSIFAVGFFLCAWADGEIAPIYWLKRQFKRKKKEEYLTREEWEGLKTRVNDWKERQNKRMVDMQTQFERYHREHEMRERLHRESRVQEEKEKKMKEINGFEWNPNGPRLPVAQGQVKFQIWFSHSKDPLILLVEGEGYDTIEGATTAAAELAKKNTDRTFYVLGAVSQVKAEVPVANVTLMAPVRQGEGQ